MNGLKKILLSAVLAAMPLVAMSADKWPSQSITFIVPYPPGGPTDIMARLLSVPLGNKLGTTVLIATHDVAFARQFAHRRYHLERGVLSIAGEGAPVE